MSDGSLKCLSVQQPWASLIIGMDHDLDLPRVKDVENRTWPTSHRGELLIHASKTPDRESMRHLFPTSTAPFWVEWPYGMILGVVELVDVITDSDSPWALEGQWHWILENPRRFAQPIPWVGRLGLHAVPISALAGQYGAEKVAP